MLECATALSTSRSLRAESWHLMANTFSQIYIQTVFAVSGRLSLITKDFKEELHKYITGIVRKKDQKLISINGMADHLHILIGLRPSMALADLVRDIKSDSSEWVNKKKLARGKVRVAGRIRSVFIRTLTTRYHNPLHQKSGTASSKKVVQE